MLLLSNAGSSLDNSVVRWCCISNAELRKCEEWALSIKSDPLVCVQATSMASCIEMIKVGESLGEHDNLHRVHVQLRQGQVEKHFYTRGSGGSDRQFMQGNFQPVEKYSCLVIQLMQFLFVLFSVMLLTE